MSGLIPPLPLPLPVEVTVTVTTPTLPPATVPTVPLPTASLPRPAPSAPSVQTTPVTPAPTPAPTPGTSSPSGTSAPTTAPPSAAPTATAPNPAECVEPSTSSTSTSSSTSAPDGSSPDAPDSTSTEPAVQLPPGECDPATAATTTAESADPLPAGLTGADLKLARGVASLEQLTVNAYSAVREAVGAGSLGDVPAASGAYLETALAHHQAALDAWNEILAIAAQPAVTTSPLNLTVSVNEQFAVVFDVPSAAGVLSSLETTAAATYLHLIGAMQSSSTLSLAASILPIDRQHVSVLQFLLGRDPTPETFATEDFAYLPAG